MEADMDCDAKACYDQVIPLVLALAQIQAGLPVRTAHFFLHALQQLKYHMVTGYGPTEKGTTSTKDEPIYRIGEGATDAPPNWTLVANACKKAYAKHSKGCQIQDLMGTIVQQAPGKMFVNNKTLCTTEREQTQQLRNL
eukprot:10797800-Ditylum_brightwellii.AAC.1